MDGGEASSRMTALEASLQDVARLRMEAQQVNAGSAMMFFTGLHSLLTVVAQASSASGCHTGGIGEGAAACDGRCHPPVGGAWAGPACRDRSVVSCRPLVVSVCWNPAHKFVKVCGRSRPFRREDDGTIERSTDRLSTTYWGLRTFPFENVPDSKAHGFEEPTSSDKFSTQRSNSVDGLY